MKILHTGDLHLDSKMESNLSKEQSKIRREELIQRYEKIIEYAAEHSFDAVLLCGDVFDRPHVGVRAAKRVTDQMMEHPEITFFYLRGNHDRVDFLRDTSAENIPENLRLFSPEEWTSYDLGEVVITGREVTPDNSKDLGLSLFLDRSRCNLVMLHGQVEEYLPESRGDYILLPDFRNKNIDYLALGHIHSYRSEQLDDRGMYCYCGCPEGRGFDECGEKGFVEITITDGYVESTFHPFAGRIFHEEEIYVTPDMGMREIIRKVDSCLNKIPEQDLLKLVFKGKTDMEDTLDADRILSRVSGKVFFAKVSDETSVSVDYESFAGDKSLKGEFVRLMQKEDLPEEDKNIIIELGIKAIMGEEVTPC